MKKVLYFVTMLSLVAVSTFASGISVGNGKRVYHSPRGFSVVYNEELSLTVNSEFDFKISNEDLVKENERISRIYFRVHENAFESKAELKAWIAQQYPGMSFDEMKLPGASGYFHEDSEQGFVKGRYFLLTENKDLVDITVEAYTDGNGLDWVAPIIHTFTYDSTPPVLEKVWAEHKVWPAGTKQKIFIRAHDDNSGVEADWIFLILTQPEKKNGVRQLLSEYGVKEVEPGLFEVSFSLNPYLAPGRYELRSLGLMDRAKNIANFPLSAKVEIEVTNTGTMDEEPPRFLGFRADSSVWKTGESHRVYFQASDEVSGVSEQGISCLGLQSLFEVNGHAVYGESCEEARVEGNGWYSVLVKVNPYVPSGMYELQDLKVTDRAGISMNLYSCTHPSEFYCSNAGDPTSVRKFRVQVENTGKADTQDPVIEEIRFASNVWKAGEKQRVFVKMRDDLSGLDIEGVAPRGWLHPGSKQPGTDTIYLDQPLLPMGGDWYYMDFVVSPFLRQADYYFDLFSISDRAGNFSTLSCDHEGVPKECRFSDGRSMEPIQVKVVR